MAALVVTAEQKAAAETGADEFIQALQQGADQAGAGDTISIDATIAAASGGALAAMKNAIKAAILVSTRNIIRASASLFGVVKLSSAPVGDPTALNIEEVDTTPGAGKVPRADGSGLLDAWVTPPAGVLTDQQFGGFPVPYIDFEDATFPPPTETILGTSIAFTNPSPVYGGFAWIRGSADLTGFGAPAGFGSHGGQGFMYNGNRNVDSFDSSIRMTVTLAYGGYISFWYRTGSETSFDYARIYVNGGNVLNRSGADTGWVHYTSGLLAAGSHDIDFNYHKDTSASNNGDAFIVDDITVEYDWNTWNEMPDDRVRGDITGTIGTDGNPTFTLVRYPTPIRSLRLYKSGILLVQGVHYTLSGGTITFISGFIPTVGDVLQAVYKFTY